MWPALAIALGKSILDEQNRKQDIASNVITQKYSPWTGKIADFSSQGANKTGSNMLQGIASGLMAPKAATGAAAGADSAKVAPVATDRAGGVTQMSKDYLSMPENGVAKSAFAQAARAPATEAAPVPASFASMFPVQTQGQTPLMLQGQNPQGQENMWLKMMQGGFR